MLVDAWAPMFAISLGIPRRDMLDMSVPEMADHVDYWAALTERPDNGE